MFNSLSDKFAIQPLKTFYSSKKISLDEALKKGRVYSKAQVPSLYNKGVESTNNAESNNDVKFVKDRFIALNDFYLYNVLMQNIVKINKGDSIEPQLIRQNYYLNPC